MKNLGLTTLPWGMASVLTFVSDRISLILTFKDLGLRKFPMNLNILPSISASCKSIRIPCLYVKSYAFSISMKIEESCSLFA